jgi:hypothetical protein
MHQKTHLSELETRLIEQALKGHRRIYPCGNRQQLHECFTIDEDSLSFWFNTEDNSTHVITAQMAA